MRNVTFGDYIRKRIEGIELPLRKLAAYLEIDRLTLGNSERGDQHASSEYLRNQLMKFWNWT